MQLRNSKENFGLIVIWLHWIIALLFLGAYMSVYYRHWFTVKQTPENWTALQLHLSFGITIGAFVILRLLWTLLNKTPKDAPGSKLEHFAAHAMHWVLYAVMIIMPITGYLGTGTNTNWFFVTEIPKFESTWYFEPLVIDTLGYFEFKEFEEPIDFIHKQGGAYVVWGLIFLHAAAALYHHYVRKDFVLTRMLGRKAD